MVSIEVNVMTNELWIFNYYLDYLYFVLFILFYFFDPHVSTDVMVLRYYIIILSSGMEYRNLSTDVMVLRLLFGYL